MTRIDIKWLALAGLTALPACGTDDTESVPVSAEAAALTASKNLEVNLRAAFDLGKSAELDNWLNSGTAFVGEAVVEPDAENDGFDDGFDDQDEINFDEIADEDVDELSKMLREQILTDKNLEGKEGDALIFRLGPDLVCGDEEPDPDCVTTMSKVPVRIRVIAPVEGDIDLALMIGEDRLTPLTATLHHDEIGFSANLGQAAKAALVLQHATEPDAEMPVDVAGIVAASLRRSDETTYVLTTEVKAPLKLKGDIDGEPIELTLAKSSASLTFIDAKRAQIKAHLGALNLKAPASTLSDSEVCGGSQNGDFECHDTSPEGEFSVVFGGFDADLLVDAVTHAVKIEGLGFGAVPTTVKIDGLPVFDFNFNDGKTINMVLTQVDELTRVISDPFSLVAQFNGEGMSKLKPDEEPAEDRRISMSVTDAAQPEAEVGENSLKMIAGRLTLELPGYDLFEVEAGMCMAEVEDALKVLACE